MKKIISIILAVLLLASLTVTAFADAKETESKETNYFNVYRCVAVSDTQHAHQMSLDGGKTWMTLKTEPHSHGKLFGHSVCKECGYSGDASEIQNDPESHSYVETYRCVAINDKFHVHQMSIDGGKTWIDLKSEAHSFAALTGLGVCKECGYDGTKGGNGEDDPGKGGNGDKGDKGDIHGKIGFFDDHAYLIIDGEDGKVTWDAAKAICEANGAHLLTITSKEEQEFVEKLNAEEETLWIGGFDKEGWNWVTDEAWGFESWTKDYPAEGDDLICTAIAPFDWINLANEDVDDIDGFIIEFDDDSVAHNVYIHEN